MQITTKVITDEVGNIETRYFAETGDRFDGTANGYGYKSLEKLNKAYWFFKNKDKITNCKSRAKKFLKDNPKIKKLLDNYFSIDNYVYSLKDGEEISMLTFLKELEEDDEENHQETIKLLNENKEIWKNLELCNEQ